MKYISNLSTLSALLDRLIIENIKKYDISNNPGGDAEEKKKKIASLDITISELKDEIIKLFIDTIEKGGCSYEGEQRTYFEPESDLEQDR